MNDDKKILISVGEATGLFRLNVDDQAFLARYYNVTDDQDFADWALTALIEALEHLQKAVQVASASTLLTRALEQARKAAK